MTIERRVFELDEARAEAVNCSDCEGMGGWVDGDGDWADCLKCEGAEGWMDPAS